MKIRQPASKHEVMVQVPSVLSYGIQNTGRNEPAKVPYTGQFMPSRTTSLHILNFLVNCIGKAKSQSLCTGSVHSLYGAWAAHALP